MKKGSNINNVNQTRKTIGNYSNKINEDSNRTKQRISQRRINQKEKQSPSAPVDIETQRMAMLLATMTLLAPVTQATNNMGDRNADNTDNNHNNLPSLRNNGDNIVLNGHITGSLQGGHEGHPITHAIDQISDNKLQKIKLRDLDNLESKSNSKKTISKQSFGDTALITAVNNGDIKMIKTIIEKGVNPDIADHDGNTILMWSAENGHNEIVKMLIEKGANLDLPDKNGNTALILSSYKGHQEIAKMLIEKGANLDVYDKNGNTVLMWSAENGYEEIAKMLIEKGANLDVFDKHGNTALILSAYNGHKEIAKMLIEKGADLDMSDKHRNTALILSSYNGYEEIAKMLIEKGADLDVSDKNGNTALILSAYNGHKEIAKMLIEKGANPDMADNDGNTALILSSYQGHQEIARMLIEKGANINWKNKNGMSALDLALNQGYIKIADILRDSKKPYKEKKTNYLSKNGKLNIDEITKIYKNSNEEFLHLVIPYINSEYKVDLKINKLVEIENAIITVKGIKFSHKEKIKNSNLQNIILSALYHKSAKLVFDDLFKQFDIKHNDPLSQEQKTAVNYSLNKLDESLKYDPNNLDAILLKMNYLERYQYYGQSIKIGQDALEDNKKFLNSNNEIIAESPYLKIKEHISLSESNIERQHNNYQESLKIATLGLQAHPSSLYLINEVFVSYLLLGKEKEAIDFFKRHLSIIKEKAFSQPSWNNPLDSFRDLFIQKLSSDNKNAKQLFEEISKILPEDYITLTLEAIKFANENNVDKAEISLRKAFLRFHGYDINQEDPSKLQSLKSVHYIGPVAGKTNHLRIIIEKSLEILLGNATYHLKEGHPALSIKDLYDVYFYIKKISEYNIDKTKEMNILANALMKESITKFLDNFFSNSPEQYFAEGEDFVLEGFLTEIMDLTKNYEVGEHIISCIQNIYQNNEYPENIRENILGIKETLEEFLFHVIRPEYQQKKGNQNIEDKNNNNSQDKRKDNSSDYSMPSMIGAGLLTTGAVAYYLYNNNQKKKTIRDSELKNNRIVKQRQQDKVLDQKKKNNNHLENKPKQGEESLVSVIKKNEIKKPDTKTEPLLLETKVDDKELESINKQINQQRRRKKEFSENRLADSRRFIAYIFNTTEEQLNNLLLFDKKIGQVEITLPQISNDGIVAIGNNLINFYSNQDGDSLFNYFAEKGIVTDYQNKIILDDNIILDDLAEEIRTVIYKNYLVVQEQKEEVKITNKISKQDLDEFRRYFQTIFEMIPSIKNNEVTLPIENNIMTIGKMQLDVNEKYKKNNIFDFLKNDLKLNEKNRTEDLITFSINQNSIDNAKKLNLTKNSNFTKIQLDFVDNIKNNSKISVENHIRQKEAINKFIAHTKKLIDELESSKLTEIKKYHARSHIVRVFMVAINNMPEYKSKNLTNIRNAVCHYYEEDIVVGFDEHERKITSYINQISSIIQNKTYIVDIIKQLNNIKFESTKDIDKIILSDKDTKELQGMNNLVRLKTLSTQLSEYDNTDKHLTSLNNFVVLDMIYQMGTLLEDNNTKHKDDIISALSKNDCDIKGIRNKIAHEDNAKNVIELLSDRILRRSKKIEDIITGFLNQENKLKETKKTDNDNSYHQKNVNNRRVNNFSKEMISK